MIINAKLTGFPPIFQGSLISALSFISFPREPDCPLCRVRNQNPSFASSLILTIYQFVIIFIPCIERSSLTQALAIVSLHTSHGPSLAAIGLHVNSITDGD